MSTDTREAPNVWRDLYRRALNEANGLTNYVEDRPELRSAERRIAKIEEDARAALATPAQTEMAYRASVVDWAVARWKDEVQHRPMANKNRRTLDDTWRQVIRFGGGDPDTLIGPSHDALMAAGPLPPQPAQPSAQGEAVALTEAADLVSALWDEFKNSHPSYRSSYEEGYLDALDFAEQRIRAHGIAPKAAQTNGPVEAGPTVLRWTSPRTGG